MIKLLRVVDGFDGKLDALAKSATAVAIGEPVPTRPSTRSTKAVEDKPIEIELSWVCDESNKCHQLVPPELHAQAEAAAKAYREAMDED